MSHQCVKCGKMYPDGSKELLSGCECGHRFFFFVRKEALESSNELISNLSDKDKQNMEKDVYDLMGVKEPEKPVILDLESIRISKPGKYEISLIDMFSKKPIVYQVGEGKYIIDLVSTFGKFKKD